ncbi:tripartite tricarboxylate transporter substrate binding protein [Sedimentitalea sp. JM2-8]|uniref:Tripartite tricarboxylate transporter substrate binding protein n=1 Tax=Sedimentitalea xiamensis TaxID=3050037 RepID=A0ABT7FES4_9RHOB|nr:tripartite tricarboxylate transporter substrate binding protein [Sedimentitalea xiamensis]MDK3073622.1 tripartite tricarboxylate transporter substrate binding protein [Sedimentitalea xiamensis]
MRIIKGLALGAILGTLGASATLAEEFPEKPIRFVTPYPPGGSHSLHAGIITTVAEAYFGQPMISVIRAGGGGVVAAAELAQGDADGYSVLFGDPTINSLRPQVEDLPYDIDAFVPVARINYSPAVFVAAADAPFDDLDGMIAYAKENPDKLIYSSDNKNGFTYVAFEMLKLKTGTQMKGIEFGGGGPAIAQVLGGNTMAYAGAPSVVGDHIEAGTLKAICATDLERWEKLPDVPTCQEAGVDIVWHFWRGVLARAGTPEDRVQMMSDAFGKLVEDEGFLRLINTINSRVGYLDAEAFGELLAREQKDLKELYDAIGG